MREIARRTLLAGISATPAAIAATLPTAVLAHPAGTGAAMGIPMTADADLIAAAGRTTRLAVLEHRASLREDALAERAMTMHMARPASITAEVDRIAAGVLDRYPDPVPEHMLGTFLTEAQDAARPLHNAHQAAMQAYRVAREEAEHDIGLPQARHVSRWLTDRVVQSTEALSTMPAQTWAGVTAKARAFQAIQEGGWDGCVASWRDNLAGSIVADVLRIGAGAA